MLSGDNILGISASLRNSAAALVSHGRIIAAAQEERFSRHKQQGGIPEQSIHFCLSHLIKEGKTPDYFMINLPPFYEKNEFISSYKDNYQHLKQLYELNNIFNGFEDKAFLVDHAMSHAASAYFPSPFTEAVVLCCDEPSSRASTTVWMGEDNQIRPLKHWDIRDSLAALYSAFTRYTGFRAGSGEYKMMGLAPYGRPEYFSQIFGQLIRITPAGHYEIQPDFRCGYPGEPCMLTAFTHLLGRPPRGEEQEITQFYMDVAASIQKVAEEVLLSLCRAIRAETQAKNLCLAGDMALNCVANGRIAREAGFERVWVQPAADNAGGALGAALAGLYGLTGKPREIISPDHMQGSFLGPAWPQKEAEQQLRHAGARFSVLSDDALLNATATALAQGEIVGWVQGRMEFGPRALGNRSILANPLLPDMQKRLNLKIKYRESFRPFAPSVLAEDVSEWFDFSGSSPYMLHVGAVDPRHRHALSADEQKADGLHSLHICRSTIPAVTHVDYSARLQTVDGFSNPRYAALLRAFKEQTGCGILINTSFNVRGEPVVCSPDDAFRCFMGCDMDILVVENCLLHKREQNPDLHHEYCGAFPPD